VITYFEVKIHVDK